MWGRRLRRSWRDLSDKEYLSLVPLLGCLPCHLDGNPGTPAQNHHPREKPGMSEKAPDKDVFPACLGHHLTGEGCVSVHRDPQRFHKIYGTNDHLISLTRAGIQEILDSTIGRTRA